MRLSTSTAPHNHDCPHCEEDLDNFALGLTLGVSVTLLCVLAVKGWLWFITWFR